VITLLLLASLAAREPTADPVQYPDLTSRGLSDCSSGTAAVNARDQSSVVCRERPAYRRDDVVVRLGAGTHVWREGSALTFAWSGTADAVELEWRGRIPMAHIVGTDVWVLTLRLASIDSAIVGFHFAVRTSGLTAPPPIERAHWRGPLAIGAPLASGVLHGRIEHDTLWSASLGTRRSISVYVPPARGSEAIAGVVYMADGQSLADYAAIIDTLVVSRQLPRLLIVGLHSNPSPLLPVPGKPGQYIPDGRSREYLPGVDSVQFAAHERFLLNEVMPLVTRRYRAPGPRVRQGLFGFSNGATFVAAMVLLHPDRFQRVITFSPGGGSRSFAEIHTLDALRVLRSSVRAYVTGGMFEEGFRVNAEALASRFDSEGANVQLRLPIGAHDDDVWKSMLPEALRTVYGEPRPR
jgi:enterochelin esterase-like enzyme